MHYQIVFFHCSFSLRLLYQILYFKCCCNCMAFLFQEAASWGWWSIWPLTCLWRSFPTSHTILEACPPLVPQSNHLRKSLFYAKGNWTTLMAGMLTLRCSLPKGEWHAERGECLATPVPEVPLAKLNVFFVFFSFVFSDPLVKSTAQVLEGRMQHLQVLAFHWCTPERLDCALSKRLWIIPVHDVTTLSFHLKVWPVAVGVIQILFLFATTKLEWLAEAFRCFKRKSHSLSLPTIWTLTRSLPSIRAMDAYGGCCFRFSEFTSWLQLLERQICVVICCCTCHMWCLFQLLFPSFGFAGFARIRVRFLRSNYSLSMGLTGLVALLG